MQSFMVALACWPAPHKGAQRAPLWGAGEGLQEGPYGVLARRWMVQAGTDMAARTGRLVGSQAHPKIPSGYREGTLG